MSISGNHNGQGKNCVSGESESMTSKRENGGATGDPTTVRKHVFSKTDTSADRGGEPKRKSNVPFGGSEGVRREAEKLLTDLKKSSGGMYQEDGED